jgi:uncharacterized protein YceK
MLSTMKGRLLVAGALTALVAGCGSVDQRADAASGVVVRLSGALRAGDGTAACALLAPETASKLEQSQDESCASAILGEDLPESGAVLTQQVYGQWAQVRVSGDTVFLAQFPGGWRVVAAGCSPGGAGPYDCTLSGD